MFVFGLCFVLCFIGVYLSCCFEMFGVSEFAVVYTQVV